MLDVHPSEHAAHTWRDFFIHIATIVVGLLIAIGLEQTVEGIHRNRERNVLLTELHDECAHNRDIVAGDLVAARDMRRWGTNAIDALRTSTPSGGFINVTLPARSGDDFGYSPSRAVWTIAKSNGTAALLPDNLAAVFDRIDHAAEEFMVNNRELNDATRDLEEVELHLGIKIKPGVTLRLSLADRNEVIRELSHFVAQQHEWATWAAYWGAESQAVLDGVTSREQLIPYADKAAAEADRL